MDIRDSQSEARSCIVVDDDGDDDEELGWYWEERAREAQRREEAGREEAVEILLTASFDGLSELLDVSIQIIGNTSSIVYRYFGI